MTTRRRRYRPGRHWLWNAQMYATKKRKAIPADQDNFDDCPAGPGEPERSGGTWAGRER